MKLEIPDPDESRRGDPTDLSFELWLGIALSALLIFFGWFLWIEPQRQAPEEPFAHIEDDDQRRTIQDRSRFDQWAQNNTTDWSRHRDELGRIFEVGSRDATEAACSQFGSLISEEAAPRDVVRPLRQGVSRRSEDTPWSCLTTLYLEDRLPEDSELRREVASFWNDVNALEADSRRVSSILVDIADGELPDSPKFVEWLPRCALSIDFEPSARCQEIAADYADELGFGDDILEMLVDFIGRPEGASDSEQYARDLEIAADALAWFVTEGQPPNWKIEETDALPDYDVDFRLGAAFQLCRLMNAPNEQVQSMAAHALADVVNRAVRSNNEYFHYRWHRACRVAFGDADEPRASVPALGVSMHDNGDLIVDYGLDTLVEVGLCELQDGDPKWFCGAQRWTGGSRPIHRVLSRAYAEGSYVEWYEPEELADVMDQ